MPASSSSARESTDASTSWGTGFRTYSKTRSWRARWAYSNSSWPETTMMTQSLETALILSISSRPLRNGMRMSIRRMSGFSLSTSASAVSPSSASATTAMSGRMRSMVERSPRRIFGSSSAIRTFHIGSFLPRDQGMEDLHRGPLAGSALEAEPVRRAEGELDALVHVGNPVAGFHGAVRGAVVRRARMAASFSADIPTPSSHTRSTSIPSRLSASTRMMPWPRRSLMP